MKKLGSNSGVYSKSTSGHGHGLDVQYQFLDALGREWRVEWDGIGRSYDPETGSVLQDTIRAGHIEIVTPKFQPTQVELDAIFSTFNEVILLSMVTDGFTSPVFDEKFLQIKFHHHHLATTILA